ncbi:MAG: HNH endonuclease, partial [Actinobacteria bacterium]
QRRRLHVSKTFAGLVRIEGDLDPEGGTVVTTALRSITNRQARDGDQRTPAQRRCDALVDVCRSYLDHAATPVSGGERPHLAVIVDLRAITGTGWGRCELDDGTVVPAETVRRIACDATVTRVVTDGPSQILDVGRATRTVPAAIRRALDIRDRGCTWAGCDRPARFCDAHHIWHWADGGPTNLDNLTLLCRPHHRMTHEGRRAPP